MYIYTINWGWLGVAKVSCILLHRGVQLIFAYNWAGLLSLKQVRIEVGCCISSLSYDSFLFLFFPVSLSSTIFFLFFSGGRHKLTHKDSRVVKPQHSQSIKYCQLAHVTSIFLLTENFCLYL